MSERRVIVDDRELRLTNLDKVLYPEAGFTKGQVIGYYSRVADVMLPHLRDRPISMRRFPEGVEGHGFFAKNCPSHHPDWLKKVTLPTSHGKEETLTLCVVNDRASLLWIANLAALEMHPYLHRIEAARRPTLVVFDLDPGESTLFRDCARVALVLRELLEEQTLEAFPKTSGGKGLHVYVPLNTDGHTYDDTKHYARFVARALAQRDRERVTDTMTKSARRGKVLIDWSQNSMHKTTVAAYSLRARPQPTASTPVLWEEVERWSRSRRQHSPGFSVNDVLKRLDEHGDLFAPILRRKQDIAVEASR
jgi:bifunctional non-homologous end joining protein LigD